MTRLIAPLGACIVAVVMWSGCGRLRFEPVPDGAPASAGSGMFLVTGNGDGTASVYRVDPITYALQQTAQGDVVVGSPNVIAATPDGRFIYMPNFTDNSLSGYAIDPQTGALSLLPGMPIAQPAANPQAVIVHPSGRFLYLVDGATETVVVYAIDAASGSLTELGSISTATTGAYMPAIDPLGRWLYVSTYMTTLAGYALDSTSGLPTMLAGSPFPAQGSNMIPAFDRSGKFLYLCANGTELRGFAVGAGGALTEVPGSPYAYPQSFYWLTPDPSGAYLLGTTSAPTGIFVWSIDPITGALTPAAGAPFATTAQDGREWGAFTPDGRHFFAGSDYQSSTFDIALYPFDATTGVVGAVTNPRIPRPGYVSSMVLVQPGG